jgi:hypothetical protein
MRYIKLIFKQKLLTLVVIVRWCHKEFGYNFPITFDCYNKGHGWVRNNWSKAGRSAYAKKVLKLAINL